METEQILGNNKVYLYRPHSLGILIEWKQIEEIEPSELEESEYPVPTRWGY